MAISSPLSPGAVAQEKRQTKGKAMKHIRHLIHWGAAGALVLLVLAAPSAQAGPEVAEPFRDYYAQHEGIRVLGYPISDLREAGGYAAQYFEKGRIEDHRRDTADPGWAFMFGRLTDELIARGAGSAVSGTNVTYGTLATAADPSRRLAAPAGFAGGTAGVRAGEFIPYDAFLRPAPGYVVPLHFWSYMQRTDLFPGGWLHDIGLPMTDAFQTTVVKNGELRTIGMQAFERTILTYDPRNPGDWQVERGNIGTDALQAQPVPVPAGPIVLPQSGERVPLPL
ncbi:hypothetical protein SE17_12340, partial [Kouleothrix aurantiaca]